MIPRKKHHHLIIKSACLLGILFSGFSLCQAQFISKTIEYYPAPGQQINAAPWGTPHAASSIQGGMNGHLSLGAFGGYVVFAFDQPVENHPDNPFGVDFSIFGNAMTDLAEPGIVWVMKDVNQNGLPDDTWYELAGSDYYFSSTIKDYRVRYTNPKDSVAVDVPWMDHLGNTGFIYANSYHTQPYYPMQDSFSAIPQEQYSLQGTCIDMPIDTSNMAFVKLKARAFGYADNRPRGVEPYTLPDNPYTWEHENSGGDPFDVGWAIDSTGQYVDLDVIHFVKVQSGTLKHAGWLGECSTEITGALDIAPQPGISGISDMIVFRDIPPIIRSHQYPLEVFTFSMGRPQALGPIIWSTNMEQAWVDENNLLTVSASGNLEITATLATQPGITATVTTTVDLSSFSIDEYTPDEKCLVYPNPSDEYIQIVGATHARITIFNLTGMALLNIPYYIEKQTIPVGHLRPGLYLIQVKGENTSCAMKLLKE